MRLEGALFVGGFGLAARLGADKLAPASAAVTAIAEAEAAIIAERNQDHGEALARIVGEPGEWRLVAIDVDGCDLALGDKVERIHWSSPAANVADVRRELGG